MVAWGAWSTFDAEEPGFLFYPWLCSALGGPAASGSRADATAAPPLSVSSALPESYDFVVGGLLRREQVATIR